MFASCFDVEAQKIMGNVPAETFANRLQAMNAPGVSEFPFYFYLYQKKKSELMEVGVQVAELVKTFSKESILQPFLMQFQVKYMPVEEGSVVTKPSFTVTQLLPIAGNSDLVLSLLSARPISVT